ncbi:MAG: tRNA (cytidine(34)-2'-O)-methyltransferase [Neomegalonema sp.]|nr:tRNA (cytidine(34)-2'-O)-methyltransferase [Neomegalonema sp.]
MDLTQINRPTLQPTNPPVRLVAYQPEMPGNLGAMIRLGACFGAPVHVVEPCGFAFSAKALRRSAMDYARRADVSRHDGWAEFQAERPPGRLVLLSTKGSEPVWSFAFRPGDYVVMGRETAGLGEEVWTADDAAPVTIPICSGERSLNVASAAAIALAEASRQLASVALNTADHSP